MVDEKVEAEKRKKEALDKEIAKVKAEYEAKMEAKKSKKKAKDDEKKAEDNDSKAERERDEKVNSSNPKCYSLSQLI